MEFTVLCFILRTGAIYLFSKNNPLANISNNRKSMFEKNLLVHYDNEKRFFSVMKFVIQGSIRPTLLFKSHSSYFCEYQLRKLLKFPTLISPINIFGERLQSAILA